MEKYETYDKDFKENLKSTSEAYDMWRTINEQNNIPPEADVFLLSLDEIRYNWVNSDSIPVKTYFRMFVRL